MRKHTNHAHRPRIHRTNRTDATSIRRIVVPCFGGWNMAISLLKTEITIIFLTIKTHKMRTLKFRAWHKAGQRYIDLNGLNIMFGNHPDKGTIYAVTEQGILHEYEIEDIDLEMWTGLTDRNGVEIYADDVIEIIPHDVKMFGKRATFIVTMDTDSWGISTEWEPLSGYPTSTHIMSSHDDVHGCNYTVIGNVHQNPFAP